MKTMGRDAEFAALLAKAEAAGRVAGAGVVPEPMYVVERVNPLDDASAVKRAYPPVMDGVCGFAWVLIRPGNSPFARYLKKVGKARKAYGGGVDIWISDYGQSLTRKEAHADAMATVLAEAGIHAYSQSRMD